MPRKNINLSEAQLEIVRERKLHFQQVYKLGSLSDIKYILRLSDIVEKSLQLKGK